jgi:hypothetical protein
MIKLKFRPMREAARAQEILTIIISLFTYNFSIRSFFIALENFNIIFRNFVKNRN